MNKEKQFKAMEKISKTIEKVENDVLTFIAEPKSSYKTVYEWKAEKLEYFQAAVEQGFLDRVCDEIGWVRYNKKFDI